MDSEDLLGAREAAVVAGVHPRTIISWIHNKWLVASKLPGPRGKYLIRRADVVELVTRRYEPDKDNT